MRTPSVAHRPLLLSGHRVPRIISDLIEKLLDHVSDFGPLSPGLKPANLSIAAKPRKLSFGKPARISFHQKYRLF